MAIVEGVIDGGVLGIAGFGVWRGQNLWKRHLELKHEREMARLSMDRMEKSIRVEMEQTRTLAEVEAIGNGISPAALPPSKGIQRSDAAEAVCRAIDSYGPDGLSLSNSTSWDERVNRAMRDWSNSE